MTSRASVRVFSLELTPSQISKRLNQLPTFSREKYTTRNVDTGALRTANMWGWEIDLDRSVPLERKIEAALRFVSGRLPDIQQLLPLVNRMDLYCSLRAEYLEEAEDLSQGIARSMGNSPIGLELAFYHPKRSENESPEHRARQSAQLFLKGNDDISFFCSLPEQIDLIERIEALVEGAETCHPALRPVAKEIRCMFESSGGGLGGVSLTVPLLKRLAAANVALRFQLGFKTPSFP